MSTSHDGLDPQAIRLVKRIAWGVLIVAAALAAGAVFSGPPLPGSGT